MSIPRRRIAFIINSLAEGGAERALINLIEYMRPSLEECVVDLVLLDDVPECHGVPRWVTKHVLDARGSMGRSVVGLTTRLRSIAPDLAISFLARANCANVIAAKVVGHRCVISERVHTSSHFPVSASGLANKLAIRLIYPRADHVVAVSRGVREDLIRNYGVKGEKVSVIYNPIDVDILRRRSAEPPPFPLPRQYVCAAGRLVPNKNFALMIRAYRDSGIPYPLIILGEGPCRPELERLTEEQGLRETILMPGYLRNPYPVIRGARFLISSSNAEGFPNALVEAMALGCPAISTDCLSGPREILDVGDNSVTERITMASGGILVPVRSLSSLAKAMKILADDQVRAQLSGAAERRAAHFGVAPAVEAYDRIIGEQLRHTFWRASGAPG